MRCSSAKYEGGGRHLRGPWAGARTLNTGKGRQGDEGGSPGDLFWRCQARRRVCSVKLALTSPGFLHPSPASCLSPPGPCVIQAPCPHPSRCKQLGTPPLALLFSEGTGCASAVFEVWAQVDAAAAAAAIRL